MKKQPLYGCVVLLLVMLLMVTACNSPQRKTLPEQPAPAPQKQATQGSEPDILVFMHESNEKKSMKMEEYIAGVVAGEMKPDWPVQALAAQAILARTFTLEAIESKGGVPTRGTQASTDIKEFQAYDAKAITENVRKAVEMTKGQVITYQGKPIQAWFHASAGGMTATAQEGLAYKEQEPPYIHAIPSPDDLAPEDIKNWSASFSTGEVLTALDKIGKKTDKVESMEIAQKGPSGRTIVLTVNKNISVSGPELRVALDSTKLKSMLLNKIEVMGERVVFYGEGYGHGVGMSQWGANKMATQGKKPEEIIGYYFKDVEIQKRW